MTADAYPLPATALDADNDLIAEHGGRVHLAAELMAGGADG